MRCLGIVASGMSTETQLRLPGGAVTNSVLSTPDNAAFTSADFTADWFGCLDYLPAEGTDMSIFGQWSTVSNQRRWSLRVLTIGAVTQLRLWVSLTGSASLSTPDNLAPVTLTPGKYFGIRATRRGSDGLIRLYHSPATVTPVWTKVGEVTQNPGTLFDSTAAMMVGGIGAAAGTSGHAYGYMTRAEYRNGFDAAGSIVASPDARTVNPDATTITDAQGRVWSLGGATDFVTMPKAA